MVDKLQRSRRAGEGVRDAEDHGNDQTQPQDVRGEAESTKDKQKKDCENQQHDYLQGLESRVGAAQVVPPFR